MITFEGIIVRRRLSQTENPILNLDLRVQVNAEARYVRVQLYGKRALEEYRVGDTIKVTGLIGRIDRWETADGERSRPVFFDPHLIVKIPAMSDEDMEEVASFEAFVAPEIASSGEDIPF